MSVSFDSADQFVLIMFLWQLCIIILLQVIYVISVTGYIVNIKNIHEPGNILHNQIQEQDKYKGRLHNIFS